jgi:pimeloyl-ACP methyl ester carboxylesterase
MFIGGAVVGMLANGSIRRGPVRPGSVEPIVFAQDPSQSPIYDVPRLDDIKIDGNPADWGDRGLAVNALANTSGKIQPKSDIDVSLRLAWNDRGLVALVTVHDDVVIEQASATAGDCIELFVSTGVGRSDYLRCAIAPGITPAHPKLRSLVFDERTDAQLRKTPAHASAARTKIAGGYVIEALIPWTNFNLKPMIGREVGFQLIVNDVDSASQSTRLAWYPSTETAHDPTKMQRLRLASGAAGTPPAVNVAAFGDYPRYHRTRINVIGDGSLEGKLVEVVRRPTPGESTAMTRPADPPGDDDSDEAQPTSAPAAPRPRVLVSGHMESDWVRPELTSADLSLPIPPRDTGYGLLDVMIDGKRVGFVDLPKPSYASRWIMPYEEFAFTPCVFSTRAFPEGDFVNATFVEDLLGPYETRVTYYDADFNKVVTADKPGRYGAVVEVRTEDGHVFKRYKTLFREPKDFSWRNTEIPVTVRLPKEMGISSAAVRLQQKAVSDYYKQLLEDEGMNRDSDTAVLLAGLFETKSATFKPVLRNSPPSMDRAWWAGLKRKLGEPVLPHLVFLPHGYLGANADAAWKTEDGRLKMEDGTKAAAPPPSPGQRWPLLLFLHGKGERGDNLEQVREAGLAARLDYDRSFREQFPAIVVAPQCPANGWWSTYELAALLDDIQARYPVDPDRVYVTGMSMGGYGTWALATEFPDRFAAIAPVCGGGDPDEAERLINVPVWTFHGVQDSIVPIAESERMVAALQKLGNPVKFNKYPDAGHDAWTETYANRDLYAWLFSHRRSSNPGVTRPPLVATPTTLPAAAVKASRAIP